MRTRNIFGPPPRGVVTNVGYPFPAKTPGNGFRFAAIVDRGDLHDETTAGRLGGRGGFC
jgi:hypothetical protein